MFDTFIFIRILNPKIIKNFQKMFIFRQELEVWCSHNSSNLTSVETFWSQEFSKNSGLFRLSRIVMLNSLISRKMVKLLTVNKIAVCWCIEKVNNK